MPAINLTRLRIQSAKLMEDYNNPDLFLRELHNFFEFYANRTIRSGAVISPIVVLPSYRVPASVLRHLELEISGQAQNRPEETLALADKLWADGYFESRLLTAILLGQVNPSGEDYLDRLTKWVSETREPNINKALLVTSLARMRQETPDRFLKLMERWTQPARKKMWGSAIQALLPLLKDKNFHNLPPVYEIVRPMIESAPANLQNDLSALICTLYEASPIETTYFLRQIITLSSNPQTVLNLRRILPSLPPPLQENLRETIRSSAK
jgi:hypothetical protein